MGKAKLRGNVKDCFVSKDEFLGLMAAGNFSYSELIDELENVSAAVREKKKKSYCGGLSNFVKSWSRAESEKFCRIMSKIGDKGFSLSLNCLDPSVGSAEVINDSHSTIAMSATLYPKNMYSDLLGFDKDRTQYASYDSPFPKKNRMNIVSTFATSKYSKRGREEYMKYAIMIKKLSETVNGNTAVFFPSYFFRDEVEKHLHSEKIVLREVPEMKNDDKLKLLNKIRNMDDCLLLAVQGANLSEGVDYPGNCLKCVVVAGLALGVPDLETKSAINYYERKFGKGMEYGYFFPAMNKAIQSAGRCIRSGTDRGVIVFADDRFLWSNYRKAFGPDMKLVISAKPWEDAVRFWEGI